MKPLYLQLLHHPSLIKGTIYSEYSSAARFVHCFLFAKEGEPLGSDLMNKKPEQKRCVWNISV
jgi:hypothetical protein